MDPISWWAATGLLTLTGVFVGAAVTRRPRYDVRRLLRETRRTPIARAQRARTYKIVGTLEYVGEPLRSPLSGRRCAAYEIVVIDKEHGNGIHSGQVIRESFSRPFRIVDDTGTALIDASTSLVAIRVDRNTVSGAFDRPTPSEQRFLQRHGQASNEWFGGRSLRYEEGILEEGERVAVYGRGTWEPDPDAVAQTRGYRDGPPMRLHFRGTPQAPLLISDEDPALR